MQALARPVYSQPPENALTISPLGPLGVTLAVGSLGGGHAALCAAPHGLSLGSYAASQWLFSSLAQLRLWSPHPPPPSPHPAHTHANWLPPLSPSTILTCWPFAGWDPHRYRYRGLSGQRVGPLVCWEVRRVQPQGWRVAGRRPMLGTVAHTPSCRHPHRGAGALPSYARTTPGGLALPRETRAMWFPGQKGPFTPVRLACFCCLVFGDGPKDKSFLPQPPSA